MGVECDRGKYCSEGTLKPTECPTGTYNPNLRGESSDSCTQCSAGKFCPDEGRSEDGTDCNAGKFILWILFSCISVLGVLILRQCDINYI